MSYKYPPIWHQLWDICACPSPARADAHICEEKYELGIDLGSKYQERHWCHHWWTPVRTISPNHRDTREQKCWDQIVENIFSRLCPQNFVAKMGRVKHLKLFFFIHIYWWEGAFCPKKFAQYLQGHWAGNLQFLWIIYLFSTLMSWKSASNRRLHPRPVLQTWVLGEIGKMRNRPTSLFVNISCFQNRIKRNEI